MYPGQVITYCAVVTAGKPYVVQVGVTVDFTLSYETGAQVYLSSSSAVTNDCGRALITAMPSGEGSALLTASWTDPNGKAWTASGDVGGVIGPCPGNSGPDGPGYPVLPTNCPVYYSDVFTYGSAVSAGIAAWENSHWATFGEVPPEGAWNVQSCDQCLRDNHLLAFTQLDNAGRRIITFYYDQLDPCSARLNCVYGFPPKASRHDLAMVCAHEIGHALGLAHTAFPNEYGSLMYANSRCWWFCGVAAPAPDETLGMAALGYEPCVAQKGR
ncbi:MAG: matrixin family metalloprotease [Armatimonadetes bacterium]|nr:matrixin family metalloprotease [Armatimonadota bacterium]